MYRVCRTWLFAPYSLKPDSAYTTGTTNQKKVGSIGNSKCDHRWSGGGDANSESEADELSDGEISKLVIVTQTPSRPKKHDGFDRTGDYTTRTKLSQVRTELLQEFYWK